MIMLAETNGFLRRRRLSRELAGVLHDGSGGWVIELQEDQEVVLIVDAPRKQLVVTAPAVEVKRLGEDELAGLTDAERRGDGRGVQFIIHGRWLWTRCCVSTEGATPDEVAELVEMVGGWAESCRRRHIPIRLSAGPPDDAVPIPVRRPDDG